MPSPIGHALAGLITVWTADAIPGDRRGRAALPGSPLWRRAGDGLTLTCAGIAAMADLDLLVHGWHRAATHSITAVALTSIIAMAVTGKVTAASRRRIVVICTVAYASHLLLDWMAADTNFPYGIEALWPFSDRWFISGWNVFRETERRAPFSAPTIVKNAKAAAQEIAILGPLTLAAWLVRVKALARFASKLPGGDHPPQ